MKLAIITSHVIQYQTPLFRKLLKAKVDLSVYFCWDFGSKKTYDPEFGKEVEWDIPLLEGFPHVFLRNYSPKPSSGFWGQVNPGMVRILARERPDVLLVYGWNSFTNIIAILSAKILGIKVLLHGETPLNQERLKPTWKRVMKRAFFPILFSLVDGFLFIGEENRKFYEHYGVPREKLFFVPYAVDNERFTKEADRLRGERNKIRTSLGVKGEDFVVLFTGKLISKKRPLDLLKAYELLITHYLKQSRELSTESARLPITPHLVFVGDGELYKELEGYARAHHIPNVHFEGFQNQTELARYYTAADVFVLPSGLGETWGLVVNEAMCFKLPVIVSDVVGCAADLVKDGENGFIVPFGNVHALAEKLFFLVGDKNVREKFGAVSRRIIARYSHEEDVKGIIVALSRVMEKTPL